MQKFVMPAALALAAVAWLQVGSAAPSSAENRARGPEPSMQRSVSGILKSVESKPNVPGARCGYHYELLVASADGVVRIMIYDRTAPIEKLDDLVDREVEVVLNGGNVARSVRPAGAKPVAGDKLADLSSVRHC